MGLHVVFSNRLEILKDILLEDLSRIPADPFEAQHVVVPGTAISRYLQLAIADEKGICANVAFDYPGSWLWKLARLVDDKVPERSAVDPEIMTWMILRILGDNRLAAYPRLAGFIQKADDLMLFELARSVAHVFDHYATYRPDWLVAWSEGKRIKDFREECADEAKVYEEWQMEIWRAVTQELKLGSTHPLKIFLDKIMTGKTPGAASDLPGRAAIFALPVIPPIYLQTIRRLSEVMDITFYLLNPCREYWFDIVPPKQLAYLKKIGRDAHTEVGNPLLADWGRSTQSAIDLIYDDASSANTLETSRFIEPEGQALLAQLQRSIFNMQELDPGSVQLPHNDRSVEIHCCHGTVRELEVLHDRLLSLFCADQTLSVDDVVVLTPDIDELGPAVDAVFGTVPKDRFIPYIISGRAMAGTNPYLNMLMGLLDLTASRMPASLVFDLLSQPLVASRFGVDNDRLNSIRSWLNGSGIFWGIDGEHRRELGLADEDRHTFRRGLDSMLLGVAIPCLDEPIAGYFPYEDLEGSRAETLGQLWLFVERLAFWKNRLKNPLPANDWQDLLNRMLADFTECGRDAQGAYDQLVGAIAELADNWRAANLTKAISSRVIKAALADADVRRRGAVPSGTVTFASLSAMRGIRYRVVCLVGMNDGSFPGRAYSPEFDLIPKAEPRRGDRQRNLEERGIFLDALLAAGEILHISYTGRDQRDNAIMPPSVLVAKLLDYLSLAMAPENATANDLATARRQLTVDHPLQPFSRRYFDHSDPRLFSYVGQYATALNRGSKSTPVKKKADLRSDEQEEDMPDPKTPFFNGYGAPPKSPDTESTTLTVDDLSYFLMNPSRFFLRRQLRIQLPQEEDVIADEEPLLFEFSEERDAAAMIIEACRKQKRVITIQDALAILQASPSSPPGSACEAALSGIWPKVSSLAERLLSATTGEKLQPVYSLLSIDVEGETWQLNADLMELRLCGLVFYRCDDLRDFDYLNAWVRHLVLCVCRPEGVLPQTRHVALDGDLIFGDIAWEQAAKHLGNLLALYRDGLFEPVPFFRKSAWKFVQKDMNAAKSKWSGGFNAGGKAESADPWHALAWRGLEADDVLNERFKEIAHCVFAPILANEKLEKIVTEEEKGEKRGRKK